MSLFNEFLLPFEVSSVLFLSAMVGVVMLAKKEGSARASTVEGSAALTEKEL
jgi:NADH-quinone oxidoreductase subunit J